MDRSKFFDYAFYSNMIGLEEIVSIKYEGGGSVLIDRGLQDSFKPNQNPR